MKYLSLLLSVLLFAICPARADDTPPANPAAHVAAPATPTTPAPVQSAPVTPSPANKPDEDTEPGAFKRRLQAAAAVITGNHVSADASADKDKEIAALKAENAKLTARVAAQEAELIEAVAHVKAEEAQRAAAVAAAESEKVQAGISAAVRQVGIPTTALTNPVTTPAAAATAADAADAAAAKESARIGKLDAVWKEAGYDRAALAGRN